jgi:hypothetical protein
MDRATMTVASGPRYTQRVQASEGIDTIPKQAKTTVPASTRLDSIFGLIVQFLSRERPIELAFD